MRTLILVFVVAGLASAQERLPAKLDAIARGYQENNGFMGSVLVAKGGAIVFEKGYGFANLEWDIPNAPDVKFRLGSITKQFTATAVLQLEEEGKLSLSDSVCKYLPECPDAWRPITVHHLMNHTSGIRSYTGVPEFEKMRRLPLSPVEIIMLSKNKPLDFQPGEGWKYNNTGYVLLGHAIEKVSGEKYDAYMKAHVFDPLGMKDTGYDWTLPVLKRRASGYVHNRVRKTHDNAEFLDMSLPHAAGSLYSTARDLYLWDRALAAGKLLKKESFDRMFTPGRSDYGFGWTIKKQPGRSSMSHGGGINGFSTMIGRFPETDAVVIVLSNVANGEAGRVYTSLVSALFGEEVVLPWERKALSLAPSIYERYVGTYAMPQFQVAVSVKDGKLNLERVGQTAREILAESETRFFVRDMDVSFEFILGPDRKANELVVRQSGKHVSGKRVQE